MRTSYFPNLINEGLICLPGLNLSDLASSFISYHDKFCNFADE